MVSCRIETRTLSSLVIRSRGLPLMPASGCNVHELILSVENGTFPMRSTVVTVSCESWWRHNWNGSLSLLQIL